MAKLSANSSWNDVYQLETSDPVKGGAPTVDGSGDATDGHSNVPHKQLLDRTLYLFNYAERLGTGTAHQIGGLPGLRNGVLPQAASGRNTMLSGPLTGGKPSFGAINGSNLDIDGTSEALYLSFSQGFGAVGAVDFFVEFTSALQQDLTALGANVYGVFMEYDTGTGTASLSVQSAGDDFIVQIEEPAVVVDRYWLNPITWLVKKGTSGSPDTWEPVLAIPLGVLDTTAGSGAETWEPYSYLRNYEVYTSTPPGTVQAFAGSAPAPLGWLLCDGAAVSRTAYHRIFAALGTTYGVGDGSTTFNLPDLRGEFIRGLDERSSGGTDPDAPRSLGSSQADKLKEHNHENGAALGEYAQGTDGVTISNTTVGTPGSPTVISLEDAGATETRPRNIALNYIIKY